MVPLNECARVSHCASFAYAQDLGRFLKRLVNLAPNVSGATIPDFPGLSLPPQSPLLPPITNKKKGTFSSVLFLLVPLIRIGLTTPSLPMTCSTTELQRHNIYFHHIITFHYDGVYSPASSSTARFGCYRFPYLPDAFRRCRYQ